MTATRRILVVMPLGVRLGGGEEMLRQLMGHGRGAGIDWAVAFLRDGPLIEEFRSLGVTVHLVEAGRFRDVAKRVSAVRAIARIARAERVEALFGWMVAGQAMAGLVALATGIPSVWYQVGTPRPDWLDRFATALPARGTLVLSREGEAAQRRLKPSRPVRLVHPGADLARAREALATSPAALRARLGIPGDGPLIGIVGRLQRWKGIHVYLDTMARVIAAHSAARGVIVGGPHETEPAYPCELLAQAARLGIADRVTFAGFQPNPHEWMQACDVVVHASDREPFGIVVVEAMALGKPVVAGASGGPAEIITDGLDGLLVPFGDARALAASIGRLIDDNALAARLGAAAGRRAEAFGADAYARKVIAATLELLG